MLTNENIKYIITKWFEPLQGKSYKIYLSKNNKPIKDMINIMLFNTLEEAEIALTKLPSEYNDWEIDWIYV